MILFRRSGFSLARSTEALLFASLLAEVMSRTDSRRVSQRIASWGSSMRLLCSGDQWYRRALRASSFIPCWTTIQSPSSSKKKEWW